MSGHGALRASHPGLSPKKISRFPLPARRTRSPGSLVCFQKQTRLPGERVRLAVLSVSKNTKLVPKPGVKTRRLPAQGACRAALGGGLKKDPRLPQTAGPQGRDKAWELPRFSGPKAQARPKRRERTQGTEFPGMSLQAPAGSSPGGPRARAPPGNRWARAEARPGQRGGKATTRGPARAPS